MKCSHALRGPLHVDISLPALRCVPIPPQAQGGEFLVVILPLHHHMDRRLLRRQLLYTAVSRAKSLLVIVGTEQAVQQCLQTTAAAPQWQQPRQQHELGGLDVEEAAVCSSSEGGWLTERLRAAAAARGLQPFPCMVFGDDGWQQA
jgi:hypothetical protein